MLPTVHSALRRVRALLQRLPRWWPRGPGDGGDDGSPSGSRSSIASRARFWDEFRQGQREADARATRPRGIGNLT